jgi:hypothetical protein
MFYANYFFAAIMQGSFLILQSFLTERNVEQHYLCILKFIMLLRDTLKTG